MTREAGMPRTVPVAWRQLASERAKLAVSITAVAVAIALVLLLSGLRRGIGQQVTIYVDHQPQVLVAQRGASNFISQVSVLPSTDEGRIAAVPGVAGVTPVAQQFAMLQLHGLRVLSLLIGYDPGRGGGPWQLAAGRRPQASGELVLDRVLADEHGLRVGSTLAYRGAVLRIVGLSNGTAAFMTPLAFTTRATADALSRRPGTVGFFFVRPAAGVSPAALARRIAGDVPGVSALTRSEVAANDRDLFVSAFKGPLLAMVSIAVVVAILVIALTVYSSTSERGREYATLKAIGLGRRPLLRLAGVQALALALSGAVFGTLLALLGARAISAIAPKYLIAIAPTTVLLMALGAVVMAAVAAYVPARFLARLDPASAFRR